MEISIVVCLGDRNGNNFQKLYDNIVAVMKDNFELVVVDNRTNISVSIDFTQPFITYINPGINTRQLHGRMLGFKVSHGDYIWFIDDDDEIVARPPVCNGTDIMILGTITSDTYDIQEYKIHGKCIDYTRPFVFFGAFNTWDITTCYSSQIEFQLWNKLIKRECLDKVYSALADEDLTGVSCNEDVFITCMLPLYSTLRVVYYNACYYIYNVDSSTVSFKGKIHSVTQFLTAIYGWDKFWRLADKYLYNVTEGYQNDIWYRLHYICTCAADDNILYECYKALKKLTHTRNIFELMSIKQKYYNKRDMLVPLNKAVMNIKKLAKIDGYDISIKDVLNMILGGKYAEHSEANGNVL